MPPKTSPVLQNPFRPFSKAIIIAYLAAALAGTIAHGWFIDSRLEDARRTMHEQVLSGNAPAPIQYRVFVHYAAEGLMRIGVPFRESYLFIRFLFTLLSAVMLHALLSVWLAPVAAAAGVLYFLAVLPLTFIRYYMQPMDLPNLFFFLAGCLLIARRKDLWLIPLIAFAMLNRETAILLVLVYAFFRYDELPAGTFALRSGAMFAVGMGIYVALRKILAVKEYYSDLYYLHFNLTDFSTWLYAVTIFGPFLYLAFVRFKDQPKFFRRAVLFVPFFLVIHYTMTIMAEPRLWLPVLPVFILGGLWTILPAEYKKKDEPAPEVKNLFTRFPKALYLAFLAVFVGFFSVFFTTYKNLHLKDRALKLRTEQILKDGKAYARGGWTRQAVEQFNRALALDPKDANIHYELAGLYDYTLYDPAKALYHYEQVLALQPYHIERKRIENEIKRLKYYLNK